MEKSVGDKITVNGTELYYEWSGTRGEGPIAVFESGYGWSLENWDPVRKEMEESTEMFFYDRAGVGKSGRSDGPFHSLQIVRNLRELLQKAKVKPPYLLVGHSFGGVNVRLFAHLYPEEIAGVILLDSCHEDQNRKMMPLFTDEVKEDYLNQFTVEATLEEFEQSLDQVRGKRLGNIPLLVVTGGNQPHHTAASMREWLDFQEELAGLSSESEHVLVENAGHAIHLDNPTLVTSLIKKMAARVIHSRELH
ncbi:alpha/beta fold hydrolase [Planococcus halotolerans]|uniref:Alpha/beta hydrolase n=1 Tax=Planococcus halotolerans TaxID=2233542 RepID=A0A365KRC7_9BACL|nr:alpha/beta hydrolase [Planococcus halotolerans]QHJ69600.1 alpha/beta fold hydrolase [Planococcus halotolerans]RAZ75548.1 alpha/beta hydrolase [Planococcus halotolerans]